MAQQKQMNIVGRGLRKLGRYPVSIAVLNALTGGRGVEVKLARKWPLRIGWFRQLQMHFQTWEPEFINAYAPTIRPGDVVLDVGGEHGEWAALAGVRSGDGKNVHIFEPNKAAWRSIKHVFDLNGLSAPGGWWNGFAAGPTGATASEAPKQTGWPSDIPASDKVAFESLTQPGDIPSITIDDYVRSTGIKPTILKMDIEGAEVVAIPGATETLRTHKPIVFASLHPEFTDAFGGKAEDVVRHIESLGYTSKQIGVDHEEHWVFWVPGGREPVLG